MNTDCDQSQHMLMLSNNYNASCNMLVLDHHHTSNNNQNLHLNDNIPRKLNNNNINNIRQPMIKSFHSTNCHDDIQLTILNHPSCNVPFNNNIMHQYLQRSEDMPLKEDTSNNDSNSVIGKDPLHGYDVITFKRDTANYGDHNIILDPNSMHSGTHLQDQINHHDEDTHHPCDGYKSGDYTLRMSVTGNKDPSKKIITHNNSIRGSSSNNNIDTSLMGELGKVINAGMSCVNITVNPVKDEINEIITFLRDPSIFKDMGARPPRVNTHYEGILKFLVSVQIMIHYV